jgi:predicted ester cyclase
MNRNEIEAFVARWLEAALRGNAREFEHLVGKPVVDSNTGEVSSPAAFGERASAVQRAFSDLDGQVDELLVDGDRIAWRWTLTGVHSGPFLGEAATGKRVRLSGTNFQRLAGGVVVAHYTLVDALGALRQLRGG